MANCCPDTLALTDARLIEIPETNVLANKSVGSRL